MLNPPARRFCEQLLTDLVELHIDPAEWTDATDDENAAAIGLGLSRSF